MSQIQPFLPMGPKISDEDLRALGLVTSSWAMAEAAFDGLIATLADSNPSVRKKLVPKRLRVFRAKRKGFKELLKALCRSFPLHREIGHKLEQRGKALSRERATVVHWAGHRVHFQTKDFPVKFEDLGAIWFGEDAPAANLTTNDIISLAEKIQWWGIDVQRLAIYIRYDGPAAASPKLPQQESGLETLTLRLFPSLQRQGVPTRRHLPKSKP